MHWCLGMYGSASTWTFNVVQKLAAALVPDRPVIARFVDHSLAGLDESAGTLVVKTHATDADQELAQRASAIIITIRDPRDAVASLLAHNKAPFNLALNVTEGTAMLCARFATDSRAILLRFEDRFYDDPTTIEKLAATFPGRLTDADRNRIFAETRREAIEGLIANIESLPTAGSHFDELTGQQDTYDQITGWHKHHAGRKGEIGRWQRELSRPQVTVIEVFLRQWMQRFGYRPMTGPQSLYLLRGGQHRIDI